MKISGELIERFLAGQCNAEEASRILNALQEQPDLLELYLSKDDWDAADQTGVVIPEPMRLDMEHTVLSQTTKKNKVTFLNRHRWLTAAAAIIALVCSTWLLISYLSTDKKTTPVAVREQQQPSINNHIQDTVISNHGHKKMRILLADGSVVMLATGSEVSYQSAFNGPTRDIKLTGEAYFKVAKNKQRPFIVYSNGISTTALGTAFTIKAFAQEPTVKVALHEGKVVVRSTGTQHGLQHDIFLLPGDALTVDTHTFAVNMEKEPVTPAVSKPVKAPEQEQPLLVFDREPLSHVLEQLSRHYHTTISYEAASLEGLSFTGQIREGTTLEKVLQNIAFLNELKITRSAQGYLVSTSL